LRLVESSLESGNAKFGVELVVHVEGII
jgi:hypothetical protein